MQNVFFYSFVIWFLVSIFFKIDDVLFMKINILIFFFLISYLAYNKYIKKMITKKYGTILNSYVSPKKLVSILSSIAKEGYVIKQIKKVDFICKNLNESFKFNDKLLQKIVLLNPTIKINIIGFECEEFSLLKNTKNIKYLKTKEKLIELREC
jgi:hypothetical protein